MREKRKPDCKGMSEQVKKKKKEAENEIRVIAAQSAVSENNSLCRNEQETAGMATEK